MKLITAMLFLVVLMFNTDKKDRKKGGKPRA
jgi:hypothetical protein